MIRLSAGFYLFNCYGVVKIAAYKINRRSGQIARKPGWSGGGCLAKDSCWRVFNIYSLPHSEALEYLREKNLHSEYLYEGDNFKDACEWVKRKVWAQVGA